MTAQQKGKGRITQNLLPTPAHTQQRSNYGQLSQQPSLQYRNRPTPNSSAQCATRQFRNASPVPDQRQVSGQGDSGSGVSRQKQRMAKKKWTHIAKVYGMLYSPWVPEWQLERVLQYEVGQDLPEDSPDKEFVRFLDELEVGDRERKDPQFEANVSLTLPDHPF